MTPPVSPTGQGVLRVPESMSAITMAEVVNRDVTYKPGYKIVAGVPVTMPNHLNLTIVFVGPDSDGDGEKQIAFYQIYPVDGNWPLERLEWLLRAFVHQWELHEADEWLKIAGVRLNNPHG